MRDAGRVRDIVFPLILIGAGAVALLLNAHVLSPQALDTLGLLWPLLLVVAGALLVLRVLLPPAPARAAGIAVALVVLAGALALAIAGPAWLPAGSATLDSTARLGAAAKASLSLDLASSAIAIRGQDLGPQAYRAHLEYPKAGGVPSVRFRPETNALEIQPGRATGAFASGTRRADLTLSTQVPWALSLEGGAGDVELALAGLPVTAVSLRGGAGDVEATLDAPRGTDVIDLAGGAGDVTLHLPRGTAWRLRVSGGASSVTLDGQELDGVSQVARSSSGFDGATDRYDIAISGGASDVSLDTNGSGA